jgi:hypothetical protein
MAKAITVLTEITIGVLKWKEEKQKQGHGRNIFV